MVLRLALALLFCLLVPATAFASHSDYYRIGASVSGGKGSDWGHVSNKTVFTNQSVLFNARVWSYPDETTDYWCEPYAVKIYINPGSVIDASDRPVFDGRGTERSSQRYGGYWTFRGGSYPPGTYDLAFVFLSDCEDDVIRSQTHRIKIKLVRLTSSNTKLTCKNAAKTVTYGRKTKLHGYLKHTSGAPIAQARANLYVYDGKKKKWKRKARTRTGGGGYYRFKFKPYKNSKWRVRAAGKKCTKRKYVRQKVTRDISTYRSRADVRCKVSPKHARKRVYLQYKRNGKWRTYRKTRLSGSSRCFFRLRPTWTGKRTFRIYAPKHWDHKAGKSSTWSLTSVRVRR